MTGASSNYALREELLMATRNDQGSGIGIGVLESGGISTRPSLHVDYAEYLKGSIKTQEKAWLFKWQHPAETVSREGASFVLRRIWTGKQEVSVKNSAPKS